MTIDISFLICAAKTKGLAVDFLIFFLDIYTKKGGREEKRRIKWKIIKNIQK